MSVSSGEHCIHGSTHTLGDAKAPTPSKLAMINRLMIIAKRMPASLQGALERVLDAGEGVYTRVSAPLRSLLDQKG